MKNKQNKYLTHIVDMRRLVENDTPHPTFSACHRYATNTTTIHNTLHKKKMGGGLPIRKWALCSSNRKELPLQWHKRYSMERGENDAFSTDAVFPVAERINPFPTNKKIKKIGGSYESTFNFSSILPAF